MIATDRRAKDASQTNGARPGTPIAYRLSFSFRLN
jgi:hypothetical protein